MSYYIYNKQGKHEGPYDEEQLRSMLKAGRLDKDELVSQNGLSRYELSRTFLSNSKIGYIFRTSSRSRRLILSSSVSFAVSLK